jgi:hypothetical protein
VIDGGTKVKIALRRMLRPDEVREEEERKVKEAAERAAGNGGGKKAGAWGGLPGR